MRTSTAKALTQRIIRRAARAGGSANFGSNFGHVAEPCTQPPAASQLQRSRKVQHLYPASRSSPARPLAMARQSTVFPSVALPLIQKVRARSFSSSEVRMPDVEATGGIVEIPLAQTGEGIADCELIRWFVKESLNEVPAHLEEAPRSESSVTKEYTPVPAPSYGIFDGGDTSIPVRNHLGFDGWATMWRNSWNLRSLGEVNRKLSRCVESRSMSNLPESTVYGGPKSKSPWKRVTLRHLEAKYQANQPITVVTAYDYPSGVHVDRAGIDICLVGDSVGMVVHGHDTTLPVTMEDMLLHCRAVARGADRPLLVGDLPFGSYEQSTLQAVASATRMLKEGGMDAVKMEGGGGSRIQAAKAISEAGIAVMGHVGLTPQAISVLGGFRPQGRNVDSALQVLDHALALQSAGCFSVVLECVPSPIAAAVTAALKIPTIGIGAGPVCSGQVLVYHDLLGMMQHPHYKSVTPKFSKQYASLGNVIQEAISQYREEVTSKEFPSPLHTPYRIDDEQTTAFLEALEKRGLHAAADAAQAAAVQDVASGDPPIKTPID